MTIQTLDMLLPKDLPVSTTLSRDEALVFSDHINTFLTAMRLAPAARAEALLQLFKDIEWNLEEQTPKTTGTPAKPSEVIDFDRYFNVRRVVADRPEMALLRSMVATVIAVDQRADNCPNMPERLLEVQHKGFETYAHLLGRTFGVSELL